MCWYKSLPNQAYRMDTNENGSRGVNLSAFRTDEFVMSIEKRSSDWSLSKSECGSPSVAKDIIDGNQSVGDVSPDQSEVSNVHCSHNEPDHPDPECRDVERVTPGDAVLSSSDQFGIEKRDKLKFRRFAPRESPFECCIAGRKKPFQILNFDESEEMMGWTTWDAVEISTHDAIDNDEELELGLSDHEFSSKLESTVPIAERVCRFWMETIWSSTDNWVPFCCW